MLWLRQLVREVVFVGVKELYPTILLFHANPSLVTVLEHGRSFDYIMRPYISIPLLAPKEFVGTSYMIKKSRISDPALITGNREQPRKP